MKSQQRCKSDLHEVYLEEINKIVLSSDDDKRLQTFYKITSYPYGTNATIVCESEMLRVFEAKAKLKMLSKECESEMYVEEKEKCEVFLIHMKTKCKSEMRNYVKLENIKSSILMITQMKTKRSITQSGHIFQIIHIEY